MNEASVLVDQREEVKRAAVCCWADWANKISMKNFKGCLRGLEASIERNFSHFSFHAGGAQLFLSQLDVGAKDCFDPCFACVAKPIVPS